MDIKIISCLVLLLCLAKAAALDFTITAPESVNAEDEFSVEIHAAEESPPQDVKMFVNKHTKEYSEIWDNGWKSPFSYIPAAFPTATTFKMRAHTPGETTLCVRLRTAGEASAKASEVCQPIVVNAALNVPSKEEPSEENKESNTTKKSTTASKKKEAEEPPPEKAAEMPDEEVENSDLEPIAAKVSAPAVIKKTSQKQGKITLNTAQETEVTPIKTIYTKQEKMKMWMTFGFTLVCVAALILFALKRL